MDKIETMRDTIDMIREDLAEEYPDASKAEITLMTINDTIVKNMHTVETLAEKGYTREASVLNRAMMTMIWALGSYANLEIINKEGAN